MDLCDERNAAFSWDETHPKKPERAHGSSDERREGPPASRYNSDDRYRRCYSQLQEDRYREHAREHQRPEQLHNRNSRRTGTGSVPVSIRGLSSFTTVTQGDSCADRGTGLHAANMRPESLDEATTYILQYQFNHAAVYGRGEDRSPEAAVRSVRSRRD
ncbi:hypothetical protein PoB_000860800 [Plakobranchus ocellatus]|uniref:Uncharacterized protein n=1 Tax=Plakobranchus ocellatus TaxID=259542 RepID=A0AAV3YIQ9_9GAST|nr:hypothetical protein PoB_000860800 [Plakobranchus ocellatus]